ncbi:MAG: protease inhibitor I42 family protein [Pseudomonas capeferrum]|jgi:inhibitor of cysteine peptidase|uniref:protease inhibitor I42 family protein n=1 Tax=Pseudomonas putida TaxID=303 RepID=UPI000FA2C753|nr:protease inhibitor I42 family protein [Pseudomonas putida]HDS1815678.1 protease inhibitor I42 family protein [Pseudomonas putida]
MTAPRLLVPLSLALLAACAQHPLQTVELDAESECPQRLQVGQALTLTLPGNPSTGYRWRIENPAASILKSLGPELYSAPDDTDVVGSAGSSTWRYLASSAGEGQLVLVYQRPWEAEIAPVQSFECKIIVR